MELLNSYKQFKVGKIYIHKNPLDIIKIESINKSVSPISGKVSYVIEFSVLETNYEDESASGFYTMYYSCMKDSYYPFENKIRKL